MRKQVGDRRRLSASDFHYNNPTGAQQARHIRYQVSIGVEPVHAAIQRHVRLIPLNLGIELAQVASRYIRRVRQDQVEYAINRLSPAATNQTRAAFEFQRRPVARRNLQGPWPDMSTPTPVACGNS